ncbi:hypothetical protein FMEAI12_3280019 [Parafrankia sp. Ea1.12]|nr:hypothetical protein FMEAI12_3280019 [Parafrankia sp. Ea1.12]
MLVVIFAIMSTFLYSSIFSAESQSAHLERIQREQLVDFPAERIVGQIYDQKSNSYSIDILYPSDESNTFAKDVMQVVGTLLVAVVGFYFGQRNKESR